MRAHLPHPSKEPDPWDSSATSAALIMTPLYYAISAVLVAWHWAFDQLGMDPDSGLIWVAVDHRPHPDGARGADPAVRQADQVQPEHAADPAQGQGAAEEVRPRPGASRPGDDEAVQGERDQPVRLVPADPDPDADLPGALPAAGQARREAATARRSSPRTWRSSFQGAELFGIPLKATFLRSDGSVAVMVVAAILVLAMTATTFTTQRQLMSKNMPRRRADRPLRPAAEAAPLRAPGGLRGRRYRLPDRASSSTGPPRTCGRWASSST